MKRASTLVHALECLEQVQSEFEAGHPLAESLVENAGYAAVHAARYATERVFRQSHSVSDVAPELKDSRIYGVTVEQARRFLRAHLSPSLTKGSPTSRVVVAVAKLADAIRRDCPDFRLAVLAKQAAILMLGPRRLGGVYAEWQTSALGVGLLTWLEQDDINRRVLRLARAIDKERAKRDQARFGLPPLNFVEMGAFGNIARACYRAVADGELDGSSAREVAEWGSRALQAMQREVAIAPEQYKEYQIVAMYAMEAAIREHLGDRDAATRFWTDLPSKKVTEAVDGVLASEPSPRLREMVIASARRAGVLGET